MTASGRTGWAKLLLTQTVTEDGTPIRDILADNVDLRAEVARLKAILQTIHSMTVAPHFTSERRWKIRDMTARRGRNGDDK